MVPPSRDPSFGELSPLPRTMAFVIFATLVVALLAFPLLLLNIPQPEVPARHNSTGTSAPITPDEPPQHAADVPAEQTDYKTESAAASLAATPDSPGTAPHNQTPSVDPPAPDLVSPTSRVPEHHHEPAALPATAPQRIDRSPAARRQRIEQYGGSRNTENAVEAGITWLALHQAPDGNWDRFNFDRQCPSDDRCSHPAIARENDSLQAGITGLALLAILGGGYTDLDGPYKDNVRRGAAALRKLQRADGGFSPTDGQAGYNNAVATFALAELYALNGDATLIEPLNRAVARLVSSQQPWGGWDYLPYATSGRNDTSITGWAIQALLAARAAGIGVPAESIASAALHFARAAQPDGRVWYSDSGTGFGITPDGRAEYRYGGPMVAVGLMAEQLLGWRENLPLLSAQTSLLNSEPPSAAKARGADPSQFHCEYYWYYGTVAMFQRGGEAWERWNASLRDAILPAQERPRTADGRRKHAYGSWPAYGQGWGKWARPAGRVYTTAICVLTLEVYYRHTPAYLEETGPLTTRDWRSALRAYDERQRLLSVPALRDTRFEIGEPVLVELLADAAPQVAAAAAVALSEIGSPMGRDVLERMFPKLDASARRNVEQAIRSCEQLARLPAVEGRIRHYDAEQRLATVELPRSYAGMPLHVWRNGAPRIPMRVLQRFSGLDIVVAEVPESAIDTPPASGEMVRSD